MRNVVLWAIVVSVLGLLSGCVIRPFSSGEEIIYSTEAPSATLVVSPGTFNTAPPILMVETVPDIYYVQSTPDLFFYGSAWYYYYGGWWYRSSQYNGPWGYVEYSVVPEQLYRVPTTHFSSHRRPERRQFSPGQDRNRDNNGGGDRNKDNGPGKDQGPGRGRK